MQYPLLEATLQRLGIPWEEVTNPYCQPHRYYHTLQHLEDMLVLAKSKNWEGEKDLLLAIVFHDWVYDPRRTDNEERSAAYFLKNYAQRADDSEAVAEAIRETAAHRPKSGLGEKLVALDLGVFDESDETLAAYELNIFKEYQYLPYSEYRRSRMQFLKDFGSRAGIDTSKSQAILASLRPVFAVYAGSFNPFHKGHYNILRKAERIFDKVIVARGVNPEKQESIIPMPKVLQYHQVDSYPGLLTDYINGLAHEATLIRGLRNSTDFAYEMNQYRYLTDLKIDIKVASIFCDKEFEHISSSGIRNLMQYGKGEDYMLE